MKSKFSKVLFICVLVLLNGIAAWADTMIAPEVFLALTRSRAEQQNSFADLAGKVTHLRRNQGGAVRHDIRFVIRFDRAKVQALLMIDNDEKHFFERVFRKKNSSRTVCSKKGNTLLEQMGFFIGDLTMDFLEYPVVRELAGERYKTLACRVLLLRAADGGLVKVWIARDYLFPLRAEFFPAGASEADKAARTLEITAFKKVGDYYTATDIALLAKDFRSRIEFSNCKVMSADDPAAKRDFQQLK